MSNYQNLLNDDDVLLVNKTLATAIGLDASMILRQVVYWMKHNRQHASKKHFIDGRWWCFNTYEQWQEDNFPFWSVSTIRRAFALLESIGLVIGTASHNKSAMMKNKWYTVDFFAYEAFMAMWEEMGRPLAGSKSGKDHAAFIKAWLAKRPTVQDEQSSVQDEQMDGSSWTDEQFKMNKAITETTTEDTTEIKELPPIPPADVTDGKTTDIGSDVHLALVEMKDAVRAHLKQYGRQCEQVAKALLGLHVGKNADLNLSRKFTPALLEKFGAWWDKNYRKDGKPLTRPKNLDSVKSYGEEFLATLVTNQQTARIIYAEPATPPSATDGMVTFNKPPKKEQAS
jgi:hypothetical protein